ncbi:MAG: ABC-F family ATP-binding cassette domain-containing protein [Parachlamydiaceae bacterium]|nr:ABC-F family ATP-binding cassette domain-containing protein [Parachlamydiaceae bacterium]
MSRLLILCTHLCKNFGSQKVLEGLSLSINAGERFALIGENGCGKTTLIRLLAGLLLPDEGQLQRSKNLTIAYLPQELIDFNPNQTVRQFLLDTPLQKIENTLSALADRLDDPEALALWANLQHEFEQKGGYTRTPIEKVLYPLKIEIALDKLMGSLSGGERMRVALAKTLLDKSDLLLLDEPTNHLDNDMIKWLQTKLSELKTAAIIISHDRKFLNGSCNKLLELSKKGLSAYGGSYDYYLNERENLLQRQLKDYERQKEEESILKDKIRELTFSRGSPKAAKDSNKLAYNLRGNGHQKSTQRALDNHKSKLQEIEKSPLQRPLEKTIRGLSFSSSPLTDHWALEFDHVSKAFGPRAVLDNFNGSLLAGERILIRGTNGCGKTTLLAIAAGHLILDSGKIRRHSSAKIGYLDQDVTLLPMDLTVTEYFGKNFNLMPEDICKELHMAGLGDFDLIDRPFKSMSVGQRKRMMLLNLVLSKPNVLLLDEPTNHLDLKTLEALEKALMNFEGAILVVSHDQTFIEKVATQVWELT